MSARDKLIFSIELALPEDVVTQAIGILARRGAGKTYTAGRLAESMLEHDHQIVVLDPVGVWWGLRALPDGSPSPHQVPVFGGLHGDLPLEPEAGKLIADVVVDHGTSAIIDVSLFTKGQMRRFATDYAEHFFHRKKLTRSPIHLFLEEAQEFVPQKAYAGAERMLGAFESLIKLGRNFGIGCTMISQRPQAVNKDALNQAELLVVLQIAGPQERKAIAAWIDEKGAAGDELLDQLPKLKTGEAVIWSPSWLGVFQKVHIAKKRTMDASATPTRTGSKKAVKLAPLDLKKLGAAIADVAKRADENDPAKLRARIRELEKKRAPSAPVADDTELRRMRAERSAFMREKEQLVARIEKARPLLAKAERLLFEASAESEVKAPPAPVVHRDVKPQNEAPRRAPSGELGGGAAAAMLRELARWHPQKLTRAQLSLQAEYSPNSSTFRNALSQLRTNGWLVEDNDLCGTNAAGLAAAGDVPRGPRSSDEVIAAWADKLGTGATRSVYNALISAHPSHLDREQLAQKAGVSPTSSTYRNALSFLRRRGLLVDVSGGDVRASSALFLEG